MKSKKNIFCEIRIFLSMKKRYALTRFQREECEAPDGVAQCAHVIKLYF